MTVTYLYDYKIGSTLVGMVNVESLSTGFPAPKSKFTPYINYVKLGDGTYKGIGFPVVEWKWGFLKWGYSSSSPYRDALRTILPLISNSVFIRTKTNESNNSYANYSCLATWPLEEDRESGRRIDFVVKFEFLQPAS